MVQQQCLNNNPENTAREEMVPTLDTKGGSTDVFNNNYNYSYNQKDLYNNNNNNYLYNQEDSHANKNNKSTVRTIKKICTPTTTTTTTTTATTTTATAKQLTQQQQ